MGRSSLVTAKAMRARLKTSTVKLQSVGLSEKIKSIFVELENKLQVNMTSILPFYFHNGIYFLVKLGGGNIMTLA